MSDHLRGAQQWTDGHWHALVYDRPMNRNRIESIDIRAVRAVIPPCWNQTFSRAHSWSAGWENSSTMLAYLFEFKWPQTYFFKKNLFHDSSSWKPAFLDKLRVVCTPITNISFFYTAREMKMCLVTKKSISFGGRLSRMFWYDCANHALNVLGPQPFYKGENGGQGVKLYEHCGRIVEEQRAATTESLRMNASTAKALYEFDHMVDCWAGGLWTGVQTEQ